MRLQLELCVADAMRRHGEHFAARLAKKLYMTADHMRDLRAGRWNDITRAELQRLTTWVKSCGGDERELFKLVPHPIWKNYSESTALIFDGAGPAGSVLAFDAQAFSVMTGFLHRDKCTVIHRTVDLPRTKTAHAELVADVTESMKTQNCIFIGGPRQNAATEVAVSNLWKAQPFGAGKSRIPFTLVHPQWDDDLISSFGRRDIPAKRGLELHTQHRGLIELRNPYLPPHEWDRMAGRQWDFAIVVVCVQPLNTPKNVTTVVIAGVTGLATYAAALEMMKETLYVDGQDIRPARPRYRILCARYRKSAGRGDEGRAVSDSGSRWVGPPWTKWPPAVRPRRAMTTLDDNH